MTEIKTGMEWTANKLGHVVPEIVLTEDYDKPLVLDVSAYGLSKPAFGHDDEDGMGLYVYTEMQTRRHHYAFSYRFSPLQLAELLYDYMLEQSGVSTVSMKRPA